MDRQHCIRGVVLSLPVHLRTGRLGTKAELKAKADGRSAPALGHRETLPLSVYFSMSGSHIFLDLVAGCSAAVIDALAVCAEITESLAHTPRRRISSSTSSL
jgi:hypothetical protein